jgi:glucosamine--fructose-6-phosphate aminotransferase (isomerizing)
MQEMLLRLRELKAETLVITDGKNRMPKDLATRTIRLPFSVDETLSPIPYIIPAQLFAAYLAAEKNLNPDQPRTLSKVTRTL